MNELEVFEELAEEETDDEQGFTDLGQLRVKAPDDVMPRLQKRMQTAQLGRDLIEKQALGFWAVIDAFLKLFFAPKKKEPINNNTQEKNNAGNLRNG